MRATAGVRLRPGVGGFPTSPLTAGTGVRWARHQAVGEVPGLDSFTEDDRYRALDEWAARRERIEKHLYGRYVSRRGVEPPLLVLYDITSTYLEGRRH
ncbi:MAG TPA: hypothetical protein P5057_11055 [Acidobacteriota bacterium]|nr:hypothetical protein [Acidobacteriota bacterium]